MRNPFCFKWHYHRVGRLARVGVGRSVVVCPPQRCISESGRRICSLVCKLEAFPWHDNPHLMHYTIVCVLGNEKSAKNCASDTVIIRQTD